jgi:hypothetical protein
MWNNSGWHVIPRWVSIKYLYNLALKTIVLDYKEMNGEVKVYSIIHARESHYYLDYRSVTMNYTSKLGTKFAMKSIRLIIRQFNPVHWEDALPNIFIILRDNREHYGH